MLSQAQVDVFERDGFIAIEGFKRASELAALRERALAIVDDFDPTLGGIFTTRDQALATDDWFLDSAAAIRCFFEEEAFRRRRPAAPGQAAVDQQDRPRDARPGPGLRCLLARAGPGRGGRRHRPGRAADLAVDVHLQAARHRRRGGLASGRHFSCTPSRCP
jgi:hypothetical protein